MRIAIDARSINNKRRHGILTYGENLINSLSELDNDNSYYLLYTSLKRKTSSMPGPEKNNFKKKIIRLPDTGNRLYNFVLSELALPTFCSRHRCNVFHSTYDTLPLRMRNTAYILTVHDLKFFVIHNDNWPIDSERFAKGVKMADKIIAVSHYTKKDIVDRYSIKPEKIEVIYSGIDERYKNVTTDKHDSCLGDRYGLERRYILGIGRAPRKNATKLIKAFSLFKHKDDFDLVITGVSTDSIMYKELYSLAVQLNIEGSLKVLGYIPDSDFVHLYKSAECFVFPSLYEGFGLPMLEAMACGTPVITSNITALPEIGGDAAIYVDPYSEEQIAVAMDRIVENSVLRDTLIEKGYRRAQEFSWRKTAEETLQLYKSCNN